jgi:hypothetical protein
MASDSTAVSFDLTGSSTFSPVDGVEKYVGEVAPGESITVSLGVFVSWDATTQTYTLPLDVNYKVGGVSNVQEKDIGIDVAGEVLLKVISVEQSGGSVSIKVANIGTRSADSVMATLTTGSMGQSRSYNGTIGTGFNTTGQMPNGVPEMPSGTAAGGTSLVEYKSSIKATKESTFTFSTSLLGSATLTLEYTGTNNQRVKQVETVSVGFGSSSSSSTGGFSGAPGVFGGRSSGNSSFNTIIYVVIIGVVAYLGYRYYKRRKKGEVTSKGIKNLYGLI